MKSRNLFIGILILFAGVIALLSALNVFDFHWSIAWSLWPMILIICGIAMLPINEYLKSAILLVALGVGCVLYHVENQNYKGNPVSRYVKKHVQNWDWDDDDEDADDTYDAADDADEVDDANTYAGFNQHFSEPYREVSMASIDIDFGAGDLEIMAPCAELAKADINSNFVKYSFRTEQGEDNASIFLSGKTNGTKLRKNNDNDLNLALCSEPIWTFNLDMGAADAMLDFSPYKMGNISIDGGACDLDLTLGDNGCDTKVEINTGASDIDIRVPAAMGCRINLKSAITGKDFKGFEKISSGVWQTSNYGHTDHQIIIELNCAISDLSVERY